MKNKTIRIWTYVLAILPLLVLAGIYKYLPSEIPVRWGINGTVEYGQKGELWLIFSVGLICAILFDVLPKIDPKKDNYKRFNKYYDLFAILMIVFLNIVETIILVETFRPNTVAVGKVIIVLVGVLFTVLGNISPKIKSNFYMGIRTPWTISNPDIWNKTQRLGGKLMFLVGVVSIISGLCLSEVACFVILMIGVAIATGIPTVMSYIWYKKIEQ